MTLASTLCRPPADPQRASPVLFRECPSGRVIAMLGGVEIGSIVPVSHHARCKAAWLFYLPPSPQLRPHLTSDVEEAKRRLEERAGDWLAFARLRSMDHA